MDNWVAEAVGVLTADDKRVLITKHLYENMDESGIVFLGKNEIAKSCGTSRETVAKVLAKLQESGMLLCRKGIIKILKSKTEKPENEIPLSQKDEPSVPKEEKREDDFGYGGMSKDEFEREYNRRRELGEL